MKTLKYKGATPLHLRDLDEHRKAVTLEKGDTIDLPAARANELLDRHPEVFVLVDAPSPPKRETRLDKEDK